MSQLGEILRQQNGTEDEKMDQKKQEKFREVIAEMRRKAGKGKKKEKQDKQKKVR